MRKKESELLRATFERDLGMRLVMVDARERFLARLAGVEDPEQKRRIIGDEFIRVFEEEAAKLGRIDFLTQGTLYPDVIEIDDVRDEGRPEDQDPPQRRRAAGRPPVPADRAAALPVQGRGPAGRRSSSGLPEAMVLRQPFPGPGLAIRIIGEVTAERLDTLREADWIVIDEIKARRAVPVPVAVVRDPDPGPVRRRHGRRPDVRQRRRDPGGHVRGRHDRRLGEAARTTSSARSRRGSSTRSPASTGSSTTSARSRPRRSSGSRCGAVAAHDGWAIGRIRTRG